jgi:hypothetical protein
MALVAGALATGADFQNLTVQQHAPVDSGTTTSLTFTTTRSGATSPVGLSFTAPPSGKVLVLWHSAIRNSNAANFGLCGLGIKTGGTIGSGVDVLAATDTIAIQTPPSTADLHASMFYQQNGLTAGNTYNAFLAFRVNGNTGTFSRLAITVLPCIA